ncbi:MAG: DEAD/DEAH box helicase [Pseudonocardiaceae bacterium]|nr:DEAD/DEAH box helicase [Pseudonocardiaceae bacterium]
MRRRGRVRRAHRAHGFRSRERVATHQRPPVPVPEGHLLPGTTPAIDRARPNRRARTTRPVAVPTADPQGFAELGVPESLVATLAAAGITTPFPIQTAALPDALAGRDVLGRGRTGSGKTLAFALPTVAALTASGARRTPRKPRALILVPTRELANQVADTIAPLARAAGQRITTVYGGVGQNPQVTALRNGIDVLVACPGRLEDLIGQGHLDLDAVEVSVLDEADHMADLGFLPAVRRLLDRTPAGIQRLLFSATLDNGVDVVVRRYLRDPVEHSVDPPAAQISTMEHHVLTVEQSDKAAVVRELAGGQGRSLLFTRTKHAAKKLAKQLSQAGVPAVELHGNLAQRARERNLAAFGDGSVQVLVATDIAARGIHVDDIGLVVHVDPPAESKAYLHRSGRTARAGADGVVVTVSTREQARDVRALMRQAGISPGHATVRPGAEQISALTGPPAPLATVPPPAKVPDRQAAGRSNRAPGTSRRAPRRRSGRRAA